MASKIVPLALMLSVNESLSKIFKMCTSGYGGNYSD